ncbi:MAG: BamA/TamA family outer membrane protein, partial [Pseudomonadota bacterium]|nr:BamA/TamA family outer membrane protein [Pseudomonadota bacterium]
PYTVAIAPTPDAALNAALAGSSELESLRKTAPAGPFALLARTRQDATRFLAALHSLGYYKGAVTITVDGRPLDAPGLVDVLQSAPANPPATVAVAVAPGPQFRIRRVTLEGTYPPGLAAQVKLASGAPAIAGQVVAARDALLSSLRDTGYALATVDLEPATLTLGQDGMDVIFRVESGPRIALGTIRFQGLDGVHEAFARNRLLVRQGDLFDAAALGRARDDLAKVPIFASVLVVPATKLDAAGQLPITVYTAERPGHAVDVGVSYATDLGLGLTAGWHDRNLFGNAEQLNLTAAFQAGGNAEIHPGYKLNAEFIKPDFLARDQSLEVSLGAVKQSLIAYDQKAVLESVAISRVLSAHWRASVGVSGEQELITQEDVARRYNLLGLPLALRFDDTDAPLNPTHGIRAALLVTPERSLTGIQSDFVLTQLSGSTYFDLSGNGRSVIALRGLAGAAFGAQTFGLPPDQRFYAGGSGTVRGYRYQSVGPQFADGKPAGGTRITAGTIELRQRVLQSFGFSLFTDAAAVTGPGVPNSSGKYAVGAGAGVFYYTPIGPIRLEGAVPLIHLPHSGSFEVYVGLGQAF